MAERRIWLVRHGVAAARHHVERRVTVQGGVLVEMVHIDVIDASLALMFTQAASRFVVCC